MSRTVTIPAFDLPTCHIQLVEKGRGSNKYLTWMHAVESIKPDEDFRPDIERDWQGKIGLATLSETEIHEYAAQALKELEHAENELARAKDRADALRMFARELYATPTLKVASE